MRPRITIDGALWVAQSIVAFVFFWVGSLRAMLPLDLLEKNVGWIGRVAEQVPVRTVGAVELTLALLILVPAMTGFFARATWIAALGLAAACAIGSIDRAIHAQVWAAAGDVVL